MLRFISQPEERLLVWRCLQWNELHELVTLPQTRLIPQGQRLLLGGCMSDSSLGSREGAASFFYSVS
jgi:hypothetical protein